MIYATVHIKPGVIHAKSGAMTPESRKVQVKPEKEEEFPVQNGKTMAPERGEEAPESRKVQVKPGKKEEFPVQSGKNMQKKRRVSDAYE